jgi:predicted O-linked N-acetylglucosamine transferase (SPINDLY family)
MGLRPSPIQINSIGFPGTLGADWYDYILVDRFGAPDAMQPFYSERLWQMPHASYPSDTTRAPQGPAPSRAECALPAKGFVFCCFNKSFKIIPDVFAIWMRLLHAVPGSVLWLLASDAEATANRRRHAAASGIDTARLIFAAKVPQEQHLARHAAADLFLDSFPYGAHTTTNDALLAGLPVLTCAGETLVTRLAGSQLHATGLPELVTDNFADYEALALRLAREAQALAELRARLAANRHTHPLFDMARYTRDFEDGLEAIWRDYTARMSSA